MVWYIYIVCAECNGEIEGSIGGEVVCWGQLRVEICSTGIAQIR